jgi:hypothetical protein
MSKIKKKMNPKRPIVDGEDLGKTLGCRHSNPDICKNNLTPNKCAFVRDDGFCIIPPISWKKFYVEQKSGNRE